mgnify:CR=1 FL=1
MSAQQVRVSPESLSHGQSRLPRHIGFIPDGNRRWAVQHGLPKEQGDASGIAPGLALFEACKALGVEALMADRTAWSYVELPARRDTGHADLPAGVAVAAFGPDVS